MVDKMEKPRLQWLHGAPLPWTLALWTKCLMRKINHSSIKQVFFGFSMTHSPKQIPHQNWQLQHRTGSQDLLLFPPGARLPLQLPWRLPQDIIPLQPLRPQAIPFLSHLRPSAVMFRLTPSTSSMPRSCLFRQNQDVRFMDLGYKMAAL